MALSPQKGVFCEGQIFDAHAFTSDLMRSVKSRIFFIDNYVDEGTITVKPR